LERAEREAVRQLGPRCAVHEPYYREALGEFMGEVLRLYEESDGSNFANALRAYVDERKARGDAGRKNKGNMPGDGSDPTTLG